MNYQIYLKDMATGEVKAIDFEYSGNHPDGYDMGVLWMWEQGNYSCDCNRGNYFYPDDETDCPCGDERFNLQKIVNVTTGQEVELLMPEWVK